MSDEGNAAVTPDDDAVEPQIVDESVVVEDIQDSAAEVAAETDVAESDATEPDVAESHLVESEGPESHVTAPDDTDRANTEPAIAEADDTGLVAENGFFASNEELTGFDELGELLRERMMQAVSSVEPATGTLDYLRHAVPARRRRRQTALATTAVTVFAVSAGVTLAVRVTPNHNSTESQSTSQGVGTAFSTNTTLVNRGTGGGERPPPGNAPTPVPAYPATTAALSTATSVSGATTAPAIPTPPMISGTPVTQAPCQSSALTASVTRGPVASDGTVYETVTVVNDKAACVVTGPPTLSVLDANGVPAAVGLYRAGTGTAAPGLPDTQTWGKTLIVSAGGKFTFEFAWVPTQCVQATTVPPTSVTTTAPPTSAPTTPPVTGTVPPTSGPATIAGTSAVSPPASSTAPTTQPSTNPPTKTKTPSPSAYSVIYSLNGVAAANAPFSASCGASLYMTDIFQPGDFPAPQAAKNGAAPVPKPS